MKTGKLKLLLFAAVSLLYIDQSKAQNWVWGTDISSILYPSERSTLTTDGSGNTYLCGHFGETITYGDITLEPDGNGEYFISKHQPDGALEWLKEINGGELQLVGLQISGMAATENGELYIAGFYVYLNTPPAEEGLTLDGVTLTPMGDSFLPRNCFVFKLDESGTAVWGQTFFEPNALISNMTINKLELSSDETQLFMAGAINDDTLQVGDVPFSFLPPDNGTSAGKCYIGSISTEDGTANWFRGNLGSPEINNVQDLKANMNDDLFLNCTWTGDTAYVGDLYTVELTSQGLDSWDTFIAKFSATGDPIWINSISTTGQDFASIEPDEDGGVMVAGTINEGLELNGIALESPGVFQMKYNFEGAIATVDEIPGVQFMDMVKEPSGNYYIAGSFTEESITVGEWEFENAGGDFGTSDIVLFDVTEDGEILWAETIGGFDNELPVFIESTSDGALVVVGTYESFELELDDVTLENEVSPGTEYFIAAKSLSLGVFEKEKVVAIDVFPNPTSDYVNIQLDETKGRNATVRIFDGNGKLVQTENLNSADSINRVKVNGLPSGTYVVFITQGDSIASGKFVIEK